MPSALTMTRVDRVTLNAKATLNLKDAPLVLGPSWATDAPLPVRPLVKLLYLMS